MGYIRYSKQARYTIMLKEAELRKKAEQKKGVKSDGKV